MRKLIDFATIFVLDCLIRLDRCCLLPDSLIDRVTDLRQKHDTDFML